jgi:hypothetical protein
LRSADVLIIAAALVGTALAGSGPAYALDDPRREPVPAESLPTVAPLKLARSTRVEIEAIGDATFRIDGAVVSCRALADRLRDRAVGSIVVGGATVSIDDLICVGRIAKSLGATAQTRTADGTLRTVQWVD